MAPVAFSPHFHLLTTLGYLSGIWAGNCLIMGWRCDLTCSGGIGWDEWREERVRWRAFRVQWEDERCWRQIKADGDADKTVREAKAFILHSQYTHTHTHRGSTPSLQTSCCLDLFLSSAMAQRYICKDTFTFFYRTVMITSSRKRFQYVYCHCSQKQTLTRFHSNRSRSYLYLTLAHFLVSLL